MYVAFTRLFTKPIPTFTALGGLLILSALLAGGCQRYPQESNESPLPTAELQAAVDTYQDSVAGILGIMLYIDYQGYQPWGCAVGSFDRTHTRPLDPKDQFRIGSITKTFTATLVLQLWEKGLVNLDQPLIQYLPAAEAAVLDSIPHGAQVTVRQALMHRSGLFNYVRSWPLLVEIYQHPTRQWSAVEVLRIVRDQGAPDFEPGESFRYSNTNYLLLGLLLESVSGMTYNDALHDRICDKLDLDQTFMPEASLLDQHLNLAHGYENAAYGFAGRDVDGQAFNPASRVGWAAGGLVSNTGDVTRFFRALACFVGHDHRADVQPVERREDGHHIYYLNTGSWTPCFAEGTRRLQTLGQVVQFTFARLVRGERGYEADLLLWNDDAGRVDALIIYPGSLPATRL